jgi:hypothetical protein
MEPAHVGGVALEHPNSEGSATTAMFRNIHVLRRLLQRHLPRLSGQRRDDDPNTVNMVALA